MTSIRLARYMMATRFELVLLGEDESHMRALGETALDEIDSLEKRLSFFHPSSELSRLNREAFHRPVPVAPDLLDLLIRTKSISEQTHGAFDPTVGPLMRCWSFNSVPEEERPGNIGGKERSSSVPAPDVLESAFARTGMHNLHINSEDGTVSFGVEGLEIDLGGIAKGYAIEIAITLLKESGIENALLHGGTSTISTLGRSYDGRPWKIGISDGAHILASIELNSGSLSVSAQSGKRRLLSGDWYGHIMNPVDGRPVEHTSVAAVSGDSATMCDAWSTAALVLGDDARKLASESCGVAVWTESDPWQSNPRDVCVPPRLLFHREMPAFQVPKQVCTFSTISR